MSNKPLSVKTLEDLDRLSDWLKKSDLAAIELEIDGARVHLTRAQAPLVGIPATAPAALQPTQAEASPPQPDTKNIFTAPMVGTFYTASSPEANAFVKVGDTVKKGQTICIIEAMKTMNQIEADRSGTIRQVLAENATPVEYGQPLFEIA